MSAQELRRGFRGVLTLVLVVAQRRVELELVADLERDVGEDRPRIVVLRIGRVSRAATRTPLAST